MMGLPCFNRRLEQTSDYSSHIRAWIQSSARSLTEGLMGGAPVQNLFLNALDLLVRQLRIHGKRENAGSRFFSDGQRMDRSEEHTSELQSRENLVCRLLL